MYISIFLLNIIIKMTYYDVLKIAPDATLDQIEAQYRALVTKANPQHQVKIIKAYDVLSDPYQRGLYDANLVRSYDPFNLLTPFFPLKIDFNDPNMKYYTSSVKSIRNENGELITHEKIKHNMNGKKETINNVYKNKEKIKEKIKEINKEKKYKIRYKLIKE